MVCFPSIPWRKRERKKKKERKPNCLKDDRLSSSLARKFEYLLSCLIFTMNQPLTHTLDLSEFMYLFIMCTWPDMNKLVHIYACVCVCLWVDEYVFLSACTEARGHCLFYYIAMMSESIDEATAHFIIAL